MKSFLKKIPILIMVIFYEFVYTQQISLENIMADPKWIGTQPTQIIWSMPQDNKIYFNWNPQQSANDSLYSYDVISGKITVENKVRYELIESIEQGQWNNKRTKKLINYNQNIYIIENKKFSNILSTPEKKTQVMFSADDSSIFFIQNENLFKWDLGQNQFIQLSNFVSTALTSPNPDNSAQLKWLNEQQTIFEVLNERNKVNKENKLKDNIEPTVAKLIEINTLNKRINYQKIQPQGQYLFYTLTNNPKNKNTEVPSYVTETGFTQNLKARTKVGQELSKVEFYCLNIINQSIDTIDFIELDGIYDIPKYLNDYPKIYQKYVKEHQPRLIYLMNSVWSMNGNHLIIDLRAVDNKDRWIVAYSPSTKKWKLVNRQHDDAWIAGPNINSFGKETIFWLNDSTISYQSESSGYSHIYLQNINNSTSIPLTQGKFEIQDAILNFTKQDFYVIANPEHPGGQKIYKLNIQTKKIEPLTNDMGKYEMYLSEDGKYLAYRYSKPTQPWELYYLDLSKKNFYKQITNLAASSKFKAIAWQEGKILTIPTRDSQTVYVKIFEPSSKVKNNSAIVFVHGAGYLQDVHWGWSSYFREFMFNNFLAERGYTVINVDYRGSSGYGRDWRTGIYRYMGGKDLDDQEDAINYLIKNYNIDANKIGMYGGSYGGFITLMALFTKPNLIKAGAALRSVTDWAHYNHGYTSNILNLPFTDSLAYYRSSPINFPKGLINNLLMCHGVIDLNVHFQDIVRLTQRLIEFHKDNWELAIYPLEDHGFREPSSWLDEYKRIYKLFSQNLP